VADRHLELGTSDHEAIDPALPLPERIHRFVRRRSHVLERMTPLRRVALHYERDSPALQRSRRRWAALARGDLERTFAAELGLAQPRRPTIAAAQAATSWSAWDELRSIEGLSPRAAAGAMELALVRILTG
jgi:hypothetical protein